MLLWSNTTSINAHHRCHSTCKISLSLDIKIHFVMLVCYECVTTCRPERERESRVRESREQSLFVREQQWPHHPSIQNIRKLHLIKEPTPLKHSNMSRSWWTHAKLLEAADWSVQPKMHQSSTFWLSKPSRLGSKGDADAQPWKLPN